MKTSDTTFDMRRLKAHLLLDNPFFGTLAYHLEDIEDRSIPTLCTNGVVLKYNPDFLATLSHAEQLGVLAHEVLHPALLHCYRRDGRDMHAWNEACDFVINAELIAAGFTLPAGVLLDPQYDGLSSEQVYSKRKAQPPPPAPEAEPEEDDDDEEDDDAAEDDTDEDDDDAGDAPSDEAGDENGDKNGEGGTPGDEPTDDPATEGGSGAAGEPGEEDVMPGCPTGQFIDGPATSAENQLTEQDWEVIAAEAALIAQRAGELPGGLARALAATREARVDWKAELQAFLSNTLVSDSQAWTRPNRRFVSRGLYLPGTMRENTGAIVVGIDTSGSVSQDMLNEFASELSGLMREARPERLVVLYCDTEVRGVVEFGPDEEIELTLAGGGGTRFQPVFDYIEAEQLDPLACFYFTDLYGPAPELPAYPVLWITPDWCSSEAPFGQLVRMSA